MDWILYLYPDMDSGEIPSFEQLFKQIVHFDGMFIELDGSFVWIDRQPSPPRQMDGMIYDRDGKLEYVEIKGRFSRRQWQWLCAAIGGLKRDAMHAHADVSKIEDVGERIRIHCPFRRTWFTPSEVQAMIEG